MHAYQHQDSSQTLVEGLAEYGSVHPGLLAGRALSEAAREFFRCHDAVHVVFGCSTALDDEAVVKIASIFGTTGGLSVLRGYRLNETLEIYRQLELGPVLRSIAHSAVVVPRTLLRCLGQRRRWPWSAHERYLSATLADIRQEFGIRVAHRSAAEPIGP